MPDIPPTQPPAEGATPPAAPPQNQPTPAAPKPASPAPAEVPLDTKTGKADKKAKEKTPSASEKKKKASASSKLPLWFQVLKQGSVAFTIFVFVSLFALKATLDPTNQYLSVFGMEQNTFLKHKHLKSKKNILEQDISKLSFKIGELQSRLENKEFFVHRKAVKEIKDARLNWVDRTSNEGKQIFGILDGVERIKDYFNSSKYFHPILSGNQIKVEKVSANRKQANFSVTGKNIFGKIFFLNTEFVEMINAFPFFKNGEIKSFSRKTTKGGDDEMQFSLSVAIQQKGEEDAADIRLEEYNAWLREAATEETKKPKRRVSTKKK